MPTKLDELMKKRAQLVADARKIDETAKSEKRSMTAEDHTNFDKIWKDVEIIKTEVDAAKLDDDRQKFLSDEKRWSETSQGRKTSPDAPGETSTGGDDAIECEIRSGGPGQYEKRKFDKDSREYRASQPSVRNAFNSYLKGGWNEMRGDEQRDLQSDLDTSGGYLTMPLQIVSQLIKFVDNAVILRQKATVIPCPMAQSLGAPSLDTDISDDDWTTELGTGTADTSMAFGKRELHPHPMAKRIKVSNKLLRTGLISPESLVRDRLGYKTAVTEEKGFMTGNGVQQPLGLFTASAAGISTARDVSTNNTTTAIGADNLYDVKYSLKPQYQAVGEWMFNRTVLKTIMQLKDGIGQYLWHTGLVAGQPDRLLDRPVNQSEYAPNTMTTGLYVGMFGDFSKYWIADALSIQIQRLMELYAETNQVGFIARMEVDGMPVLEEAFARVKLA